MRTEPSDRTIVLQLLRGAVPERADEISTLWRHYGHAVEVAPNTKGITMNADAARIKFDTKTIIHAMTPSHGHWGNRRYPPIAKRLTAMISGYSLPASSSFWLVTACLLIALMRQENRPLDFVAKSNQELVEVLLDRLS